MRLRKRKWVDPYLENEKDILCTSLKGYKDFYLEIGMGMGDFIIESSLLDKDRFYVGLEKDRTCVAKAIVKAKEKDLNNLKILLGDANNLLEMFDEGSVSRIYLHFSDPWPKKGYHKRRLTYPTFLKRYEYLLKDGGQIIFKTDNEDFFKDSLDYFKESSFVLEEINEDYHAIKRDEPITGYEAKFINEGKPIYYARYRKG